MCCQRDPTGLKAVGAPCPNECVPGIPLEEGAILERGGWARVSSGGRRAGGRWHARGQPEAVCRVPAGVEVATADELLE